MNKTTSKHSIRLMLAVILLAVCMGMTATYAAFSVTATSTGTVSFDGGFQVTQSVNGTPTTYNAVSGTTLAGMTATVNLGTNAVTFSGNSNLNSVKISSGGVNYWYKVTLTISTTGHTDGVVTGKSVGAAAVKVGTDNVAATSGGTGNSLTVVWKNTDAVTADLTVTVANLLSTLVVDKSKLGQSGGEIATMGITLNIQAQISGAIS